MNGFPAYEEVHVISDIHMGGMPGSQILQQTERLAAYIRWLAAYRIGERVALVLNGDVIDTLAEGINSYVATADVLSTVSRIMDDPNFSQVWDALSEFVHGVQRSLVIVIGKTLCA